MTAGKPFQFTTAPLCSIAARRFFTACSTTCATVGEAEFNLCFSDPGELQQIMNQSLHAHRAIDRVSNIFVSLFIQLAAISVRQQLGIAGNHPQRLLQVVRSHVSKLLELFIRAGQFGDLAGQFSFRLAA